jgi:hypothetical protein
MVNDKMIKMIKMDITRHKIPLLWRGQGVVKKKKKINNKLLTIDS